jgi:hypothetical protein
VCSIDFEDSGAAILHHYFIYVVYNICDKVCLAFNEHLEQHLCCKQSVAAAAAKQHDAEQKDASSAGSTSIAFPGSGTNLNRRLPSEQPVQGMPGSTCRLDVALLTVSARCFGSAAHRTAASAMRCDS